MEVLDNNTLTAIQVVAGAIALLAVLGIALVITNAIIRAGQYPAPTSLVVALSVLTMLAIAGGIGSNNDEAWTIAAAGIGALAGSVTAVFQQNKPKAEEPTKDDPPPSEEEPNE